RGRPPGSVCRDSSGEGGVVLLPAAHPPHTRHRRGVCGVGHGPPPGPQCPSAALLGGRRGGDGLPLSDFDGPVTLPGAIRQRVAALAPVRRRHVIHNRTTCDPTVATRR